MNYWLLKSEPNVWSINQQIKAGAKGADWDGVRNYQAANNLKKMQKGDLCFFYHSNIGKEIVGIVEVIKTAFIDPTDKMKKLIGLIWVLMMVVFSACNSDVTREADVLFKDGKYNEAIESYTEYLSTKPKDIKSLYNRGRAYEEVGQLEEAREDFEAVLAMMRPM
mgnify:CR=1 FL=1